MTVRKDDVDTSGVHLWLILWKAFESVQPHAARSIATLGLGISDFAVLEALLHKGPLPVNVIGEKVHLTSGSVSIAIDRLERKKLVERKDVPGDRRVRLVHLTPDGQKLIECAFGRHAAALEHAVAGLDEHERRELIRLLKKLGLDANARLKGLAPSEEEPSKGE